MKFLRKTILTEQEAAISKREAIIQAILSIKSKYENLANQEIMDIIIPEIDNINFLDFDKVLDWFGLLMLLNFKANLPVDLILNKFEQHGFYSHEIPEKNLALSEYENIGRGIVERILWNIQMHKHIGGGDTLILFSKWKDFSKKSTTK